MRPQALGLPVALVLAGTFLVSCEEAPSPGRANERLARGRTLYEVSCAACHQNDGEGRPGVASPLARSEWVTGPTNRLIRIALHGVRGGITVRGKTYNLEMPGFAFVFGDADLAAVLSYVRDAWGNRASEVPAAAVEAVRHALGHRDSWTEEELLAVE